MNDHDYSEEDREKAFPIHIEMGEDAPVIDLGERVTKLGLPESGCLLVDFTRNEDGTLTVNTVCLPDEAGETDEPKTLEEAMNRAQTAEASDEEPVEDDMEDE